MPEMPDSIWMNSVWDKKRIRDSHTKEDIEICPLSISLKSIGMVGGNMEKRVYIRDNYLMILMPREVDHYASEELRRQADRLMEDERVGHVVFDFSETDFMDSSGIGVIMGRYQKIACFGGKVIAVHVNDRIKRIIDMSGLHRFVEIGEV